MLTKKQHQLLMLIHDRLHHDGVSPSFDEMKDALGLKSKSGIHRLITALEERGFIRRLPNKARALEILRLPETETAKETDRSVPPRASGADISEAADNVLSFKQAADRAKSQNRNDDSRQIPLHGRIAAGTPIEALEQVDSFVDVPATMLGTGEHYALTIDGDSMVEAGILDGDIVVIEGCQTARDGEIIVALVDNEEATLKTIKHLGKDIALIPSNQSHETRTLAAGRVKVQGKLVGLLRRYH